MDASESFENQIYAPHTGEVTLMDYHEMLYSKTSPLHREVALSRFCYSCRNGHQLRTWGGNSVRRDIYEKELSLTPYLGR